MPSSSTGVILLGNSANGCPKLFKSDLFFPCDLLLELLFEAWKDLLRELLLEVTLLVMTDFWLAFRALVIWDRMSWTRAGTVGMQLTMMPVLISIMLCQF